MQLRTLAATEAQIANTLWVPALVCMLPGHSREAIDFAHMIFGGSARHVCSLVNFSLHSDATEHYELVFSAMSEFLAGSKYYEQLVMQSCKNIARELKYATNLSTAVYYSLFQHTNSHPRCSGGCYCKEGVDEFFYAPLSALPCAA